MRIQPRILTFSSMLPCSGRINYPHLRSHKLEILGRYLFGELPGVRHHRALDDAELAARVLLQILLDNHGAGSA
ncbi:MAG: hypothetical protein WC913_02955 [Desulfuromonas sp.]